MSLILFCHFLSLQYSQQPFAGRTFGLTLWLVTTSVLKLFSLITCIFFYLISLFCGMQTKKVIPTGFFAVVRYLINCYWDLLFIKLLVSFLELKLSISYSAAMLCFYSYVMISGGNPPPKKLQSSAGVNS